MKVVLFCGGLGTRLREHSDTVPKPMVAIGYRPIIWYLMRYYAHYGHTEFILCLGYRGDQIKQYFLNYDECLSADSSCPKAVGPSGCSAATSMAGRSRSPRPACTRTLASG